MVPQMNTNTHTTYQAEQPFTDLSKVKWVEASVPLEIINPQAFHELTPDAQVAQAAANRLQRDKAPCTPTMDDLLNLPD